MSSYLPINRVTLQRGPGAGGITRAVSVTAAIALVGWSGIFAGEFSFEQRVRAQEAIERVYYSHQIGTIMPFEQAVSREVLEKKVRTYLGQSAALEKFWRTPVTAEALERELERVAENTRFPERLGEIYAVLGHDSVVIQECFVRPLLVDRLARDFFAFDERIHAVARAEVERLHEDLLHGAIDLHTKHPARSEVRVEVTADGEHRDGPLSPDVGEPAGIDELSATTMSAKEYERWLRALPDEAGAIGPIEEDKESFTVRVVLEEESDQAVAAIWRVGKTSWDVWWRDVEGSLDAQGLKPVSRDLEELPAPGGGRLAPAGPREMPSGGDPARLDPCEDEFWDNGSLDDVPDARRYHTAVWTGSLMVVWGGEGSVDFNTGGRYDPLTDTWSPTSTNGAPSPRHDHTAIWTGSEMIVWGGRPFTDTGGRYDPLSDAWTPTSTTGAASARAFHTAVWTGSEMILWGGWDTSFSLVNSGGRYDPAADTWIPTTTIDAPIERYLHTAVWTGSKMVVWGGADDFEAVYDTGGRYDPATDTWTPTSTIGAPEPRSYHSAVWTGSLMIVWGGDYGAAIIGARNTGGRYDPATDSWTATSTTGVPSGRLNHTAIWTGDVMVIWGSGSNTGGRYDPVADSWSATSTANAPSARSRHTAVWTGSLMIVWGGTNNTNTGGRYDPVTNSWTPTFTGGAPGPRTYHTAVWTGTLMIVWGGNHGNSYINTGGRYDPLSDTWMPTSTSGAPIGRLGHSAVWTGNLMAVWGGGNPGSLNTGGRYHPLTDSWTPVATIGAPSPRDFHTGIWSGGRMIVWGGNSGSTNYDNGGSYDPATNTWSGISVVGAPSARSGHNSVWTGSRMIVWGGEGAMFVPVNTGGIYDPELDEWSPLSTTNAPPAASGPTAVWTGSRMVVWGGRDSTVSGSQTLIDTGGRYDPITDSWLPTSMINAPSARGGHTAVWTGSLMVIWGGDQLVESVFQEPVNTGGIYDPAVDQWMPTTNIDAPTALSAHSAVWTGKHMIVWGGNGGRYHPSDADSDGITICGGDCDDGASAVYAGAPDLCDGLNNDCSDPSWPALSGTLDWDDDEDALSECAGDCDDTDAAAWEIPGPVSGLNFSDEVTMVWSAPTQPGGTTPHYDVLRATEPMGFASSLTCVEHNDPGTSGIDATNPPLESIAYYLTRARNGCGFGPVGAASDGTPRAASDCP